MATGRGGSWKVDGRQMEWWGMRKKDWSGATLTPTQLFCSTISKEQVKLHKEQDYRISTVIHRSELCPIYHKDMRILLVRFLMRGKKKSFHFWKAWLDVGCQNHYKQLTIWWADILSMYFAVMQEFQGECRKCACRSFHFSSKTLSEIQM